MIVGLGFKAPACSESKKRSFTGLVLRIGKQGAGGRSTVAVLLYKFWLKSLATFSRSLDVLP